MEKGTRKPCRARAPGRERAEHKLGAQKKVAVELVLTYQGQWEA